MPHHTQHWNRFQGLNLMIGLTCSLSLTLCAFEYKHVPSPSLVCGALADDLVTLELPYLLSPPPQPKVRFYPTIQEASYFDTKQEFELIFDELITSNLLDECSLEEILKADEKELASEEIIEIPPKLKMPEIIETGCYWIDEDIDIALEEEVEEMEDMREYVTCTDYVEEEEAVETLEEEVFEEDPLAEEPWFCTLGTESYAMPLGGYPALYKHIKKKLKYPRRARKAGIEGKVFLTFTINKHGVIQDVEVLRGIGWGCDAQAVKVMKKSPKWEPARQRGKPVPQKMTFSITFKLKS